MITRGGDSRDWQRVWQIVFDAADDAEARPSFFSVQVHDPAWLEQRREIRSFFIQEVGSGQGRAGRVTVSPRSEEFMDLAVARVKTARAALALDSASAVQAMLANP